MLIDWEVKNGPFFIRYIYHDNIIYSNGARENHYPRFLKLHFFVTDHYLGLISVQVTTANRFIKISVDGWNTALTLAEINALSMWDECTPLLWKMKEINFAEGMCFPNGFSNKELSWHALCFLFVVLKIL